MLVSHCFKGDHRWCQDQETGTATATSNSFDACPWHKTNSQHGLMETMATHLYQHSFVLLDNDILVIKLGIRIKPAILPGGTLVKNGTPTFWKIPWTEKPGGQQPIGSKSQDTTEYTHKPWLRNSRTTGPDNMQVQTVHFTWACLKRVIKSWRTHSTSSCMNTCSSQDA